MTFSSPQLLFGLAIVPIVVVLYVVYERRRRVVARRFSALALWPAMVDRAPGWRRHVPFAILLLALATLLVGAERPHTTVSQTRREATVMLAIDTSKSMGATDVHPSRLDAARSAAAAFLKQVPAQFRVGVVAFGSHATVALPPTTNRTLAATALADLRVGDGTAIGDAVALAAKAATDKKVSDGTVPPAAVLMISDGTRDGGADTPQAAASKAKALHVPVYTVLVGTADGTVTETLTGGYQETIHVPPTPSTLQAIAKATGGQYFTATNDSRLREVYKGLASRFGHHNVRREVSDFAAGAGALLLAAGAALSALWLRRVP